jgi:uncharacterized protein
LPRAALCETGFDLDRQWGVVDARGEMLTQRELPRLALIQCQLRGSNELVLRAPGMLGLHVLLDAVAEPTRVQVWGDVVKAWTIGALAAQWMRDFLGQPGLELVRFDPDHPRESDRHYTGEVRAATAFPDGYPLLVANEASLADVNQRLAAQGHAPVEMRRFRPNIVLQGLAAWDEDHVNELWIDAAAGQAPLHLRLVKPCVRCSVPNVDPQSAEVGTEPGRTLAGFRSDPRMKGGITFGMNAIVVQGFEAEIEVGAPVHGRFAL